MKKIYFALWILFLIITILIGNVYRPFIYENNIYDYGFADMGYNIIAVLNVSLLSWIGFYRFTKFKIVDILIHTAVYLFFEVMSFFFNFIGTFDIKDCFALIFGSVLTFFLLYIVEKNRFIKEIKALKIHLKNLILVKCRAISN